MMSLFSVFSVVGMMIATSDAVGTLYLLRSRFWQLPDEKVNNDESVFLRGRVLYN